MNWTVPIFVSVLYVHLFNAIATLYFESERQLTLADLGKRIIPHMKIHIEF
jgi:hypothetical protein